MHVSVCCRLYRVKSDYETRLQGHGMSDQVRKPEWTVDEVLNSGGNLSYITTYLHHYESEIDRRREAEKDLSRAPMYYAWLSTASALVYALARDLLYWDKVEVDLYKAPDVFEADYLEVLNGLFKSKDMDAQLRADILLFAGVRHLIVHKGFPNLHASTLRRNRPLAAGAPYTKTEVMEVLALISDPKNYPKLLEAFQRVSQGIRSLQVRKEYRFRCPE